MWNKLRLTFAASSVALTVACGGGGSSQTPAPVPVSVTCPNGTSQAAATPALANSACPLPLLVSVSPTNANAAVSVDTFASVNVVTDSTLDATSIAVTSVTLKSGTTVVAGTATAVGTKGFKFAPTAKLSYAQPYTFAATIKDTLGRSLVVNSTFTTASISCVSPQTPNSAGDLCIFPPIFASTPLLLPDLRQIYSTLCGSGGDDFIVFHKPTILDLNKDGKKDIVINLSCNQRVVGGTTADPIRNRVVAFLQQNDRTFINATKTLFGTDVVDIGGASVNAIAYDFNADGYEDIVFAVNQEDGRLLPDATTNVQNSYLLSNGKGQYTVGRFGTYQWGYDVHLMDNELGKKDLVSTPIGYGTGPDAWRYSNGWNQLATNYGWITTPYTVIFKERAISGGSRIAITGSSQNLNLGLSLYERTSNTDWSRVSDLSFGNYTWITWTGWNTSVNPIQLISVDGQDYINPTLQLGCELKIKPDADSVAVMIFGAYKLPTAVYNGTSLFEGVNMTYQSKLVGVSAAGHLLSRLNLPVRNEVTNFSPYRMMCGDVNGDGYDDIVVLQLDRSTKSYPFIYINDKQGGFSLVDPKNIPSALPIGYGVSSIYADIDGDGISDLLYWTEGGVDANGTAPVQMQLFRGLRNISEIDLK